MLPVPPAGRLLIFRLAVVGEMVGMAGVVAALSVASDLNRGHRRDRLHYGQACRDPQCR